MKTNFEVLPPLYFSYGSNINREQMARRCPTAEYLGSFHLRGWELEFGNHANIVRRKNAVVPGAMWMLTKPDLDSLDRYEGYPHYYTTRNWKQDGIKFFFYEMTAPASGNPSEYYIRGILEGYRDSGLDPQYLYDRLHNDISRIQLAS